MAQDIQIATTVDGPTFEALKALAQIEDRSVAAVLRRGARRELIEHKASKQLLKNGKTRGAIRNHPHKATAAA